MFHNMSVYYVIITRLSDVFQCESRSVGQVIDHLLYLLKTMANLEGMYIFRKNNHCLSLAKKHNLEIFSKFKEIKQQLPISRSVIINKLGCGSNYLEGSKVKKN